MFTFSIKKLLFVIVLAIFGVLAHWGVWTKGIYAMGWNTSLYWLGVWYLLLQDNNKVSIKKDWPWLAPLWLIAFSFALFENPWLKLISAIILPMLTGIFYVFGQVKDKYNVYWNERFFILLIEGMFMPLASMPIVFGYCQDLVLRLMGKQQRSLGKRILLGLLLLMPLAVLVTALLASADRNFSSIIASFFTVIFRHLNIILILDSPNKRNSLSSQ